MTTKRLFADRRTFLLFNVEYTKTDQKRFHYLSLKTQSKGWLKPVYFTSLTWADYEWVDLSGGENYKYWRRETTDVACTSLETCQSMETALRRVRQLHQAHRRSEISSYCVQKSQEASQARAKQQNTLRDEIRNLPRLPEGS